jgi:dihydroorotase
MIRNAKKRGVKVTCETCPHYFSLTEKACEGYNTNAKINPPLRTEADVKAIIEGIADDTIDIIATDHAPHHADEKNIEFSLAANGIVGFETALPLAVTKLVRPGIISMTKLVEKMSLNPAKLLSINKGTLQIGSTADITIVDINDKFTVDVNKFQSKSKNSPFGGMELYGAAWGTIVAGNVIVSDYILL